MGNICPNAEQRAAALRNAQIDAQLDAQRAEMARTVRLLLLGAGESGKSTLVKQMKIIHGDGYSDAERATYKATVCDNLVHSMRAVLEAMGILRIDLGDQANRRHAKEVLSFAELVDGRFSAEMCAAIAALWADSGVQSCFRRSNEYQLNDSAEYYFNSIDRISQPDYVPTQQDVLRSRVRTTGILETSFKYKDITYRMFDVGGQRSERRKWIHCFEDVTAIIFVTALSGYDMKRFEDEETNRSDESVTLFDAICNNAFFKYTSMILFLNKTDLFSAKLASSPFNKYFPEYTGANDDVAATKQFILEKFLAQNKQPEQKQVYSHFTCATSTENIQHVFDAVSDIIVSQNLQSAGLI